MFIGEFTCLGIYGLSILYNNYKEKNQENKSLIAGTQDVQVEVPGALKTKINPFLLLIPATFDICSSTLSFFALT
jgi:hypothetical protein